MNEFFMNIEDFEKKKKICNWTDFDYYKLIYNDDWEWSFICSLGIVPEKPNHLRVKGHD